MAQTPSTMLPLGTPLPGFTLTNAVDGKSVSSTSLEAQKGVLVMFICNHCPFVVHVRSQLVKLANAAVDKGFSVVAINSNSEQTHPQDGPSHMKALAQSEGWKFPFLFDATQEVAKAFQAACTPDFYLFDAQKKLAYRGQLDDSRPSNGKPVTGADLQRALDAVSAGEVPDTDQKPSIGCNIKWHPGNW
ncbi:MAG: thioredoxin family protein [Myxococcaceae bacterium]